MVKSQIPYYIVKIIDLKAKKCYASITKKNGIKINLTCREIPE